MKIIFLWVKGVTKKLVTLLMLGITSYFVYGQDSVDVRRATHKLMSDLVRNYNTPAESDIIFADKMISTGKWDSTYLTKYLDFIRKRPLQLWIYKINETFRDALKNQVDNPQMIDIIGYLKMQDLLKKIPSLKASIDTSLIDKKIRIMTEKDFKGYPKEHQHLLNYEIHGFSDAIEFDKNRYLIYLEKPGEGYFVFFEVYEDGSYVIPFIINDYVE